MVLSRPSWPVFLINFSLNPVSECKQSRDAGSHPYHRIRFRQTADAHLTTFV